MPRWSPDGSRLAYLAKTSGERVTSSSFRERGRSRRSHARKATSSTTAWSPDGRELAFVAADPHDAAPFFYAGDNDYTATALTPPDHLWVVSASGGTARRLTERIVDDRADRSGRHLLAANRVDARRQRDHLHARREHV